MVNNEVYATEVVCRFDNVINLNRIFGNADGIRFKDISCLFLGKSATLNMI